MCHSFNFAGKISKHVPLPFGAPPSLRYRSRIRKHLRVCFALFVLSLAPIVRAQAGDTSPHYTIDAIRYATVPGVDKDQNEVAIVRALENRRAL